MPGGPIVRTVLEDPITTVFLEISRDFLEFLRSGTFDISRDLWDF